MADPIWIEGRADGHGVLGSEVTLRWSGGLLASGRRHGFSVLTAAGDRVRVTCFEPVVLAPVQRVRGRWRELDHLAARPDRPDGLHDDAEVELAGAWLLGGDRVAVLGEVTNETFVPDTGGLRDAPARRPTVIAARAIGVGPDGKAAAQAALDREQRR